MTIRLLSTYDGFSPNDIITIDPALEAAFIAAGNATATLTGGVVAYRERQPVMIQPAVKKRGSVSLIANRKAIVPLTEGSALTITPAAGTTGTYQRYDASGAAVGALTTIGTAPLVVGSFEGDFTVEIKCTTGSLVAKTADAALGAPTPGGMTPLIGTPPRALSSTVLIGDSLNRYGNDPALGSYSNSPSSWFNDYMRANGQVGLDIISVQAVAGAFLDDVISTQMAAAIASGAEVCWMHCGINNLNSNLAHNDPVATVLSKAATIIAAGAAAFKVFIVDSLNPVLQSGATGAKGRAASIPTVNAGLRTLCSQYSNVIFNDTYAALVDPASAALNPLANVVRTDDGIHYLSIGARLQGYASFLNFGSKLLLTKYKTAGANLLPDFSGTGGTVTGGAFLTVTGTPPPGWEMLGVSGAAATNSVAITALAPDMVRLTFANTGPSAATSYLRVTGMQALVLAGMVVQPSFGFQASGLAGLNRIASALRINGATVWNGMGSAPEEPAVAYPQTAHGGIRSSPPWTLPAGAITNFEFIIAINIAATSGAATVDLYAPTLKILT